MDTIEFISQSLRQVHIRLVASCEGLTQDQVLWRPAPHANNIGFILWHVARAVSSATAWQCGHLPAYTRNSASLRMRLHLATAWGSGRCQYRRSRRCWITLGRRTHGLWSSSPR